MSIDVEFRYINCESCDTELGQVLVTSSHMPLLAYCPNCYDEIDRSEPEET